MRIDEIKQQNEKYYYCEDYILSLRKRISWIPLTLVVGMGIISFRIRNLMLMQHLYLQTTTQELGTVDVMQWINEGMKENFIDFTLIVILVSNFILAILVLFGSLKKVIKSYDLYKMRWIRIIPVILYTVQLLLIYMYYSHLLKNLHILFFAFFLDLLPVLCTSRFLFPLESRPVSEKDFDLKIIYEWVSKMIIQSL